MEIGSVYLFNNVRIFERIRRYKIVPTVYQINVSSISRVEEVEDDGTIPLMNHHISPFDKLQEIGLDVLD